MSKTVNKETGFLEYQREIGGHESVESRIQHFQEFQYDLSINKLQLQGARCMDCGVPFCHSGCPLGNLIPDWNDLVYQNNWQKAIEELHATNNFPEITGRVCPAPCEASCVLNINDDPVSIKQIEFSIAERAIQEQWIQPMKAPVKTGKTVAVIGSGPAGLTCAQQLARVGHNVTVYERDDRPGGLLTYGIPDFKLAKDLVFRRVQQMEAEGVRFILNCNVGVDLTAAQLVDKYDAVCLTGGARQPRTLPVEGSDLNGIHFAMDFLTQQNRLNLGDTIEPDERITAHGKRVVVLGGGDTGSDCVGTSHRQGAIEVLNYEILPKPPANRFKENPWPEWPLILYTSSSHEEGGLREYSIMTKRFSGGNGAVQHLHAVKVMLETDISGKTDFKEVPGSEFIVDVDLVLLALGFVHPEHSGVLEEVGVQLDARGNVAVDCDYMTTVPGVFAAGDMSRGQSLVVWAIADGRKAAKGIDKYLMGETGLP